MNGISFDVIIKTGAIKLQSLFFLLCRMLYDYINIPFPSGASYTGWGRQNP